MKRQLLVLLACAVPLFLHADDIVVGPVENTGGGAGDMAVKLQFQNLTSTVALQFDLVTPTSQLSTGAPRLEMENGDHEATSRDFDGYRRVVVHSPSNEPLPDDLAVVLPVKIRTGGAAGGPTLTVKNLSLTDEEGETVPATIAYPPIDEWRQQYFTEAQLADPDIVGDDRDPDGDGLNNLEELVFGGNPTLAEPGSGPRSSATSPNSNGPVSFAFQYRQANAHPGAELRIDFSDDLENWEPSTSAPTVLADDGSVRDLEVQLQLAGDRRRYFVRFRAVRTAPGTGENP